MKPSCCHLDLCDEGVCPASVNTETGFHLVVVQHSSEAKTVDLIKLYDL